MRRLRFDSAKRHIVDDDAPLGSAANTVVAMLRPKSVVAPDDGVVVWEWCDPFGGIFSDTQIYMFDQLRERADRMNSVRSSPLNKWGYPLSRPASILDAAMSLMRRGCDRETIARTMAGWAAGAAEEAWQAARRESRTMHPDAGGDDCTDDGNGCCVECDVALVRCEACSGFGYHRACCTVADSRSKVCRDERHRRQQGR